MLNRALSIFKIQILYIFIIINVAQASFSQCVDNPLPFREGEVISYLVYYNWGFIWLNAGWVDFKIKSETYKNQEVLHFDSYGSSHKSYDWLFKVRDRYQVYVDEEKFQPLWYHRQNYEGGWEVDNKYFFDWDSNRVFTFTENSDKPLTKDTLSLEDCTLDVLSLIYYFRTVDFSGMEENDTIPVVSIIDNEVFDLYIRFIGREEIKDRNGNKFKCVKFKALLVEGTIFKGGEDLTVWATDDENRVPVLVEAKILIGSVKAYLESYSGLKYPKNYSN